MKRHAFFASISWDALLAKRITPPFKPTVVSDEAFHFDTAFTSKTPRGELLKLLSSAVPTPQNQELVIKIASQNSQVNAIANCNRHSSPAL